MWWCETLGTSIMGTYCQGEIHCHASVSILVHYGQNMHICSEFARMRLRLSGCNLSQWLAIVMVAKQLMTVLYHRLWYNEPCYYRGALYLKFYKDKSVWPMVQMVAWQGEQCMQNSRKCSTCSTCSNILLEVYFVWWDFYVWCEHWAHFVLVYILHGLSWMYGAHTKLFYFWIRWFCEISDFCAILLCLKPPYIPRSMNSLPLRVWAHVFPVIICLTLCWCCSIWLPLPLS